MHAPPLARRKQQEINHENARDDEPKQVAVEAPRFAFGIVGTVRVRESQLVVLHWKGPTSTVEPPRPKAVKSAFTITGEEEEGNSGGWRAGEQRRR